MRSADSERVILMALTAVLATFLHQLGARARLSRPILGVGNIVGRRSKQVDAPVLSR